MSAREMFFPRAFRVAFEKPSEEDHVPAPGIPHQLDEFPGDALFVEPCGPSRLQPPSDDLPAYHFRMVLRNIEHGIHKGKTPKAVFLHEQFDFVHDPRGFAEPQVLAVQEPVDAVHASRRHPRLVSMPTASDTAWYGPSGSAFRSGRGTVLRSTCRPGAVLVIEPFLR